MGGMSGTGGTTLPLRGRRVLVVDDDPSTCEVLSILLGDQGAEVTCAESAAEALKVAATFDPELTITDFLLPDGDGCDLLPRLRESAGAGTMRAVVLSANPTAAHRSLAREAGFDVFLAKPEGVQQVVETATTLLRASPTSGRPLPDD